MTTTLTRDQKKHFRADYTEVDGTPAVLIAKVRYDDECGNGHNTFSITGELYDRPSYMRGEPAVDHESGKRLWLGACGCLHDEIAKRFPELAPLIKWHLTSSDGPMHYIANTVYHADEHGPTHAWVYFTGPDPLKIDTQERLLGYVKARQAHEAEGQPGYRVEWDARTAKVRDLDAARASAVWPEATDEDLTAPGLRERLEARHAALMAEFRAAVESLGFTY